MKKNFIKIVSWILIASLLMPIFLTTSVNAEEESELTRTEIEQTNSLEENTEDTEQTSSLEENTEDAEQTSFLEENTEDTEQTSFLEENTEDTEQTSSLGENTEDSEQTGEVFTEYIQDNDETEIVEVEINTEQLTVSEPFDIKFDSKIVEDNLMQAGGYSESYKSGVYYQRLKSLVLTNNQVDNLLAIAKSQVGYHQGRNSSDLSGYGNGDKNTKYTEYARFHGNNPADWCCYFVSWCARQAGIPNTVIYNTGGCGEMRKSTGWYYDICSEKIPQPGDLLLFERYDQNTNRYVVERDANGMPLKSSHIAIVEKCENGIIYYYEGNSNFQVQYTKKEWLPYRGNKHHFQGFIRPYYETGAGTGGSSGEALPPIDPLPPISDNISLSVTEIKDICNTTATIKAHCSKAGKETWVSTCGVYIGTDPNNLVKINSEEVSIGANNMADGTGFNIWYNLESELGYCLSENTTYYFKFYAVCNGREYFSEVRNFTTQQGLVVMTVPCAVINQVASASLDAYSDYNLSKKVGQINFNGSFLSRKCTKVAIFPDGTKRFCTLHTDGTEFWFEIPSDFTYVFCATEVYTDMPDEIVITNDCGNLRIPFDMGPSYANSMLSARMEGAVSDAQRHDDIVRCFFEKNVYNHKHNLVIVPGKLTGFKEFRVDDENNYQMWTPLKRFKITVIDVVPPSIKESNLQADATGGTITGKVTSSLGDDGAVPDLGISIWRNHVGETEVRDKEIIWNNGNGSIRIVPDGAEPDTYQFEYRLNYADYNNQSGVYNVQLFARDINGNVSSVSHSMLYSPQEANTKLEILNFTATDESITLTWNDVETLTGYNIYRKENKSRSVESEWELIATTYENSYCDSDVKQEQQYCYSVSGYLEYDGNVYESNMDGESAEQNAVNLVKAGLNVELRNPEKTYIYTGKPICPEIDVYNSGKLLKPGIDYTVKYSRNTNASISKKEAQKPMITISGKGNLSGSASTTFDIQPKNITDADIVVGDLTIAKNSKVTPLIIFNNYKLTSKDYVLQNANKKYTEDDMVYVSGKGNYTGELSIPVRVVEKKALKKLKIEVEKTSFVYNGLSQKPFYQVKDATTKELLEENVHYVVSGLEDAKTTNAGTIKFTVTGINEYTGSVSASYAIKPRSVKLGMKAIGVDAEGYIYSPSGVMIGDDIIVTNPEQIILQENVDYKIKYSQNKKVGYGKYTISFINNYKGSKSLSGKFAIKPLALSDSMNGLSIVVADKVYSGKANAYKSVPYVMLNGVALKSSDFTCKYYKTAEMNAADEIKSKNLISLASDQNESTVYVKVTGKGNYLSAEGEYATATYKVVRKDGIIDMSKTRITVVDENGKKISKMEYTGKALKPSVKVEYKVGAKYVVMPREQYKVEYVNNINYGKSTIVITGIDGCCGSKTATFTISPKNIKSIPEWLKGLFEI